MRGSALLLLFASVALASCKSEPTFDERYEAAQKEIRETAEGIDKELEQSPDASQTTQEGAVQDKPSPRK